MQSNDQGKFLSIKILIPVATGFMKVTGYPLYIFTGIGLHSAARIRGYEEYFRAIHSYLNTQLRGYYQLINCSNLSLQFTCSGVNVDILLSPYFRDFGEYCNFLETIDRTQLSL